MDQLKQETIFEISILIIFLLVMSIGMYFMMPPELWSLRYHGSCVIAGIGLIGSINMVEIIFKDIKKMRRI